MRFYHRTDAGGEILAHGFRDATGFYLTTTQEWSGVWLSDVPLDGNEGAKGDDLLAVDVPDDVAATFADYEWIEEGKPHREWLLPAELLNSHATVTAVDDDDVPSRFG